MLASSHVLSRSQIDRLGERLKAGITTADIELLNEYRESFRDAYVTVRNIVQSLTAVEPSGRAAKSIPSIVAKLHRETTRLSQMQDIAGLRIVATDLAEQNRVVALLLGAFPDGTVIDRRQEPNHGYRAVHLVVHADDRPVEIQVRTKLQHEWAELSEAYSDFFPGVKYGDGDEDVFKTLVELSTFIELLDVLMAQLSETTDESEQRTLIEKILRGRLLLSRYMKSLKATLPSRG